MTTATATRPERTLFAEPAEAFSYSELPPEVQEKARESYRETGRNGVEDDDLTELLAETLEYEFGIEVNTRSYKAYGGKTYQCPDIEWDLSYCQGDGVSFKAALNIDKVVEHGVPGCEYFSDEAQQLGELWRAASVLEAVACLEYDLEWQFGFDPKHDCARKVAYACWNKYEELTAEAIDTLDKLADAMQDVLDEIYKDACRRLEEIGYAEIEYRESDECIGELLENSPQLLFTEEGEFDS